MNWLLKTKNLSWFTINTPNWSTIVIRSARKWSKSSNTWKSKLRSIKLSPDNICPKIALYRCKSGSKSWFSSNSSSNTWRFTISVYWSRKRNCIRVKMKLKSSNKRETTLKGKCLITWNEVIVSLVKSHQQEVLFCLNCPKYQLTSDLIQNCQFIQ